MRQATTLFVTLFLITGALFGANQKTLAQGVTGAPVFLTPTSSSVAALQTHTTDLHLEQSGNSVVGTVETLYRLRNETASPIAMTLRASAPTESGTAPLPADLVVTVGGSQIALNVVDGVASFDVSVPPSGRLDVRLSYSYNLGSAAIQQARYAASTLGRWAATTSFRLAILVPPSIPEEAWLAIVPSGWNYGPTASADIISIRWVYEGNLPAAPFSFTFVNPAVWQQASSMRAAAAGGGIAQKVQLGDLYTQLSLQAQTSSLRERFYGQAMAAYSDAVEQGTAAGALTTDLAQAYVGQARLFRQRTVSSGGVSSEHAKLLVETGTRALAALPAGDPMRSEVEQWVSDGLSLVLANARANRDWAGALGILAQMEQNAAGNAGSSLFGPEAIAEERQRILFEQSLQLLEEGQRDAAIGVSGEGIVGPELQPPPEAQSLFASWQSTVTVGSGGTRLVLAGTPAPGKDEAARAATQTLVSAWNDAARALGGSALLQSSVGPARTPLVVTVTLPAGATGLALANSTPLRPDWALLRTILAQTAPEISGESSFLRRELLLKLPLDLRTAGEQWSRLASDLDNQATALDAQGSPTDRSQSSALEAALKAKVQAANYRAEANNWRSLVNNSQVVALLEGPRGAPSDARAWQVTVSDPPQTLQYSTWGMNPGGVLAIVAAALAVILLLAAIIWSLL